MNISTIRQDLKALLAQTRALRELEKILDGAEAFEAKKAELEQSVKVLEGHELSLKDSLKELQDKVEEAQISATARMQELEETYRARQQTLEGELEKASRTLQDKLSEGEAKLQNMEKEAANLIKGRQDKLDELNASVASAQEILDGVRGRLRAVVG